MDMIENQIAIDLCTSLLIYPTKSDIKRRWTCNADLKKMVPDYRADPVGSIL